MEVRNSAVPLRNGLNRDRANPQPPHREGDEYSTNFISIRQSRVKDDLNHIDLTPPSVSHDYSNVDIPGENEEAEISPPTRRRQGAEETTPPTRRKKGPGESTPPVRRKKGPGERSQPPAKPTPFQPKEGDMSNGRAADVPHNSTSAAQNHFQNRHSTENPVSKVPPNLPPPRQSPPGPPRVDYDAPFALKTKPPVKKKPTLTTATKPGMYDDPDEVIATKKKIKPQKPSRDNIVNGNKVDDEAMYDIPEEGVYNTAEAVYDERGQTVEVPSAETPAVPFSPKFDDGIYMESGGNGAKKQAAPSVFCEWCVWTM